MRFGFSLVELSIVLVILGLLTGGILAGQSLIRAAEWRSTIAQTQRIQAAIYSFRDKYRALPGDMRNATDFWGAINGTASTCVTLASPDGRQTCNGNGDGIWSGAHGEYGEYFHSWVQLAAAGLIEGNYTGKTTGAAGTAHGTGGINSPNAKLSNVHFESQSNGTKTAGDSDFYAGDYNNVLTIQGPSGGASLSRILLPEDVWNMDVKLDDGRPAYGRIRVNKAGGTWQPLCATNADPALANYDLTQTTGRCWIYVLLFN